MIMGVVMQSGKNVDPCIEFLQEIVQAINLYIKTHQSQLVHANLVEIFGGGLFPWAKNRNVDLDKLFAAIVFNIDPAVASNSEPAKNNNVLKWNKEEGSFYLAPDLQKISYRKFRKVVSALTGVINNINTGPLFRSELRDQLKEVMKKSPAVLEAKRNSVVAASLLSPSPDGSTSIHALPGDVLGVVLSNTKPEDIVALNQTSRLFKRNTQAELVACKKILKKMNLSNKTELDVLKKKFNANNYQELLQKITGTTFLVIPRAISKKEQNNGLLFLLNCEFMKPAFFRMASLPTLTGAETYSQKDDALEYQKELLQPGEGVIVVKLDVSKEAVNGYIFNIPFKGNKLPSIVDNAEVLKNNVVSVELVLPLPADKKYMVKKSINVEYRNGKFEEVSAPVSEERASAAALPRSGKR